MPRYTIASVTTYEVSEDEVFHYTNSSGFAGIINSGVLWATSTHFTNDHSEVGHGIELLRRLLRDEYAQNGRLPPDSLFSGIMTSAPQLGIVCFTDVCDDLSQWRAYGGSSGYCIGFKRPVAATRVHYIDDSEVSLSTDREHRAIQGLTKEMDDFLEKFKEAGGMEGDLSDDAKMSELYPVMRDANRRLASRAYAYGALSKHVAFAAERESRLVVPLGWGSQMIKEIKFRPGEWLTPYTEIGLGESEGRLPITRVIIGPNSNIDLHRRSARMLLDSRAYRDIDIQLSKAPYRG